MNPQIEKIIRENRQAFDNKIPPEGHLYRFEQRLISQNKPKEIKRRISFIAAIAASILLLFWIFPQKSGGDQALASDSSAATMYYQFKISEQIDSINILIEKNEEVKLLVQEAIQSMQQEMDALIESRETVPEDNYIPALILCYDKQVETLKNIQSILETNK